jgi:hypothetical protein
MKRLFVCIFIGVISLTAPVRAEADSFCSFKGRDIDVRDRSCKVSKTYNSARKWTATRIKWSDGVITQIEVQTINRRDYDRVDSRYGLASVDGVNAEYTTFSDGGICFTLETNQNKICYR